MLTNFNNGGATTDGTSELTLSLALSKLEVSSIPSAVLSSNLTNSMCQVVVEEDAFLSVHHEF